MEELEKLLVFAPAVRLSAKLYLAPLLPPVTDRCVEVPRPDTPTSPEVKDYWLPSWIKTEPCRDRQEAIGFSVVLTEREVRTMRL